MNEYCWALTGQFDEKTDSWSVALHRQVMGEPTSVEADWEWAISREEEFGDLAGFAHTHGVGAGTNPSSRDIRTMRAWCLALGKPLLCLIAEGESLTDPAGYEFNNSDSSGKVTEDFRIVESG